MKMLKGLKRKALIISLIRKMNEKDSWTGETHIQKCTYFLENFLNIPMNYNFILYKHGPFSFDLRDELSSMRADNFIEMQPRIPYGATFLPGNYASVLETKFVNTIQEYKDRTDFIVEKLASKSVKELECVATALYVKKNEKLEDDLKVVNRIIELKPHITRPLAEEAVKELNNYISEARERKLINDIEQYSAS